METAPFNKLIMICTLYKSRYKYFFWFFRQGKICFTKQNSPIWDSPPNKIISFKTILLDFKTDVLSTVYAKPFFCIFRQKQDRVRPVDNRPSPTKPHRFLKKNLTWDAWHLTHNTWHVTIGRGEHSLKISAIQLLRFGCNDVLNVRRKRMTRRLNQQISDRSVVEQPRQHRVC